MVSIVNSFNQFFRSAIGQSQSSQADVLFQSLFGRGPFLPTYSKVLSGHSMGSGWVVSDYTSLYRGIQDLLVTMADQFSISSLGNLKDLVTKKAAVLSYHAFGFASSLSVIIGLAQLKGACSQIDIANRIGDQTGVLIGRLSQLKATSLAAGAAGFSVFRSLSIYETVHKSSPKSLVSRVNYGMMQAALAVYTLFMLVIGVILGIQIREGKTFLRKIEHLKSPEEQIAWMQSRLSPGPDAVLSALNQKHGSDGAQKILIDEALETGKEHLSALIKELEMPAVSDGDLIKVVREIVNDGCSGWTEASVKKQVRQKLLTLGLQLRVEKEQLKQSAKIGRILDSAGLVAIEEVKSLKGRTEPLDPIRAKNLVETISNSAKSQIKENVLVILVCVVGIAAMVLSMVCTAGTPLLISLVVMSVFNVVMLMADVYRLYASYKSEQPVDQDKKMLLLSTVMAIAPVVTLVSLSLCGIFTAGLFPLAVASALCAIWLAQNALTYWVMNRNERRFELKNPTLETFLKALDRDQGRVIEMFSNLPKDLKSKLQSALKHHGQDMKQATLSVMQQVEQAKKRKFEEMRQSLVPFLVR